MQVFADLINSRILPVVTLQLCLLYAVNPLYCPLNLRNFAAQSFVNVSYLIAHFLQAMFHLHRERVIEVVNSRYQPVLHCLQATLHDTWHTLIHQRRYALIYDLWHKIIYDFRHAIVNNFWYEFINNFWYALVNDFWYALVYDLRHTLIYQLSDGG